MSGIRNDISTRRSPDFLTRRNTAMPEEGGIRHRQNYQRKVAIMFHRLTRRLLTAGAAVATIAAGGAAALGAAPAQAASSNLFASVTANGTLAHGNGVIRVTHIGIGRYEVTFSPDVRSCAYVATTI